jgi:CheY-like chemotaxis protein
VGRRVLIADSNADAAESLALLLRLCGHDAATAATGPDALAAASTFRPDAVFLALWLPQLDGFEVCRQIRANANGHRPRLLVALTGSGQEQDRQAGLDAGFDHFLLKPADPNQILELLK